MLGRWNIEYCQRKLNTKIDQANTDHCGTCVSEPQPVKNVQGMSDANDNESMLHVYMYMEASQ
jgi:hypothetical protein